ncbi:MAG TPA: SMC-Scp complex subunit ScpB [Ignavibacteria bacterium]|nr:SMC-Scp complex subunit ScpB [Ignavibacteria bacterium]
MVSTELKNIVESIIFASEEEITSKQIKDIIDKSGLRISLAEVEESVSSLNDEYQTGNKSFEILKIAGGFSFATKKEYGRFIGRLFEDKQRKKLSPSALETLAIIAYKQPITRSEMEFIRGVNVDYIVNSLLEKEMITIHGRADAPGRPILYGTTKNFLKVLGLNSLEDLPKLKEINEILKNQEIEGITEADIELFNSVNNPDLNKEAESGQLELVSSEDSNDSFISENDLDTVSITEGNISDDIEFNISNSAETVNAEAETEPDININENSEEKNSDTEEFTGLKEETLPESDITENNEVEIFLKENETDKNESESKE